MDSHATACYLLPMRQPSLAVAAIAVAVCAVAISGCDRSLLGLPAVAVSATSPDGAVTAYVRNHPSIDPPSQSLWMRLADGRDVQASKLAPDQDWSNLVAWSADSTRAGFLVQDSRLALVDASSGRVLGWTHLVEDRLDYPTAEVARDLALSADGAHASYRVCKRASRVLGVSEAEADASCGPIVTKALLAEAHP